jgi:hypothetical protein
VATHNYLRLWKQSRRYIWRCRAPPIMHLGKQQRGQGVGPAVGCVQPDSLASDEDSLDNGKLGKT